MKFKGTNEEYTTALAAYHEALEVLASGRTNKAREMFEQVYERLAGKKPDVKTVCLNDLNA